MLLNQCVADKDTGYIMTVNGPVKVADMGVTLTHEHVLVDFIGADSISDKRYVRADVVRKVLPYLREVKKSGCVTFFECTPAFLGRDPQLLKILSDSTGLNIVTNTGFYGANNNKYIPSYALNKTSDQLASEWIREWEDGIDGTGIKPGFIKIAVNKDSLSDFHKILITAAARAHLKTGLTIASHTGPAVPAVQQLEILMKEGVAPEAFIWVHAVNEKDPANLVRAAQAGAWISLDNLNEKNIDQHLKILRIMKQNDLLNKVLLSHDAGWYDPAKENGGIFRGYTTLFEKLIPALLESDFKEDEIHQIIVVNPAKAFEIRIRKNTGENDTFQLTDLHIHLKGGFTIDSAIVKSKKENIIYGIVTNCGLGFPVHNDSQIDSVITEMKKYPQFYIGMQAEGREWVNLFSGESMKKFDYVFSDAMTFTDEKGRRNRIWLKEETWIDDEEQFMEYYVNTIVKIFTEEPINIYVNPTFLPEQMSGRYKSFWTDKRMKRVIDAAKKNNIAIEINNRYRIPSAEFIAKAKAAGVQFTVGTNNKDNNFAGADYAEEIIKKCGLSEADFFLPATKNGVQQ
jgi:phosphotriesterase-related protein